MNYEWNEQKKYEKQQGITSVLLGCKLGNQEIVFLHRIENFYFTEWSWGWKEGLTYLHNLKLDCIRKWILLSHKDTFLHTTREKSICIVFIRLVKEPNKCRRNWHFFCVQAVSLFHCPRKIIHKHSKSFANFAIPHLKFHLWYIIYNLAHWIYNVQLDRNPCGAHCTCGNKILARASFIITK